MRWRALSFLELETSAKAMRNLLIGTFLLFWLAACTTVQPPTSPPTPQVLHIAMTPATRTWQTALRLCEDSLPALRLLVEEIPASQLAYESGLNIRLGVPDLSSPYFAAQIGEEQIVVVVNPANPLQELGEADLRALFTGRVSNWNEFVPSYPEPVQVWSYPESDELNQIFSTALWQSNAPMLLAYLAPDPFAMVEAISDNPGAIGYLPSSWLLDNSVNPITVSDALMRSLTQPVLLVSIQEPQDLARNLISCLQSPTP